MVTGCVRIVYENKMRVQSSLNFYRRSRRLDAEESNSIANILIEFAKAAAYYTKSGLVCSLLSHTKYSINYL